jgi:hypothetical protein
VALQPILGRSFGCETGYHRGWRVFNCDFDTETFASPWYNSISLFRSHYVYWHATYMATMNAGTRPERCPNIFVNLAGSEKPERSITKAMRRSTRAVMLKKERHSLCVQEAYRLARSGQHADYLTIGSTLSCRYPEVFTWLDRNSVREDLERVCAEAQG